MLHALNQVIFVKLVDSSFDPSTKMRGVRECCADIERLSLPSRLENEKKKKGVMKQKQEG